MDSSYCSQDTDDGDNDEEFDEGEGSVVHKLILVNQYKFEHIKSFSMQILGFLSGLKGSDNLFVTFDIVICFENITLIPCARS